MFGPQVIFDTCIVDEKLFTPSDRAGNISGAEGWRTRHHQEIVETLVFPARSDHVVDP